MTSLKFILLFVASLLTFSDANSQSYSDLHELKGFSMKAFYSPGNEDRARIVAARCEKPMKYGNGLVEFTPSVSLFILNPEHWKTYATHPVYGMPHYTDDKRLVIASEDNNFWKSFIPPLDKLPVELAARIKQAYTTADGTMSMTAFFDLLALHELGHGFHQQGGLTMQRLWMQELFVTSCCIPTSLKMNLQTYLLWRPSLKWWWLPGQRAMSSRRWLILKNDMTI